MGKRNSISGAWNGSRYDIEAEIMKELSAYTEEVSAAVENAAVRLGKEAAQKLKETSPRSTGNRDHYADGWTVRKQKEGGRLTVTIYNRRKPHLTHLLEYGHLKPGGQRVNGKAHIEPVQEQLNRGFERACEEIIKNGG